MKRLFLLLLLISSFQANSRGRIDKLSRNQQGALVQTVPGRYQKGDTFEVIRRGREVGRVQFIRYSSRNPAQGLVRLIEGEMQRGDLLQEQRTSKNDGDLYGFDDSYSKGDHSSRDFRPIVISGLIGWDYEWKESTLGGGFTFGFLGAYRFTEKWSAGLRFNYSFIPVTIPATTVTTTTGATLTTTEATDSLSTMYLLLRGGYHILPQWYVGPTLGMVRTSIDGASEMSPAFGIETSAEFFLTDWFSLGANLAFTYIMEETSFSTISTNAVASVHF